jgi:lipoate---protein ligase
VEAVLEGMDPGSPPVIGWSGASPDAMVVGRSASAPPVDLAACAREGVDVVRRSSGGGPVLWDAGLLALDVWLPRGHALAPDDVVEAYRWLGEALALGLRDLGADARVVGVAEARSAAAPAGAAGEAASRACYGGLSPYEVVAGAPGRKVVGLAQIRRRAGTVLQAGILLRHDAPRLASLLARDGAPADEVAAALDARAAGLDALVRTASAGAVTGAVDRRLAEVAGRVVASPLGADEEERTEAIAGERFRPIGA